MRSKIYYLAYFITWAAFILLYLLGSYNSSNNIVNMESQSSSSLTNFNNTQNKNSKKEIEIVNKFLVEPNLQNKLKLVRKNSDYLKNNSIEKLISKVPKEFINIMPSNEIIEGKEIIIDVVIKKVLVGGNYVNMTHTFFVLNDNGHLEIDLDASFYGDTTIYSMWMKSIAFSKALRV